MPMIDLDKLAEIIADYKREFKQHRPDEIFKWEAVSTFQQNWNPKADDFYDMLMRSLRKQGILLTRFEFMGIRALAKEQPDSVRDMFVQLFAEDETSLDDRIDRFLSGADELAVRSDMGTVKHNQNVRSVCVYMFLHKPEDHYLYIRVGKFKSFAKKVGYTGSIVGSNIERLHSYYAMCNEVLSVVSKDEELVKMSADSLMLPNDTYCPDEHYHLLVDDLVYYGFYYWKREERRDWWPSEDEYHPGITKEKWMELWRNNAVFDDNSKSVIRSFMGFENGATCTQASDKYGKKSGFYNAVSSKLAKRVQESSGCELPPGDESAKWWPILYVGKYAERGARGYYAWKLRQELRDALEGLGVMPLAKDGASPEPPGKRLPEHDKNTILYGAPGTGKTYNTVIYAVSIIEDISVEELNIKSSDEYDEVYKRFQEYRNNNLIEFTTFHQSYGYEEFIGGIRPVISTGDSSDNRGEIRYELHDGVFKAFCDHARKPSNSGKNHVFIIDEINRGNISKIFGELITLIEPPRRIGEREETWAKLPYFKEEFGVPNNVYLVATMNTADRSIAMLDTALRRRFRFVEMLPDPDVLEDIKQDKLDNINLPKMLSLINQRITALYDREHVIGHAYFTPLKDDPSLARLAKIFENSILPLLQEYFFDDYEKIQMVLGDNQKTDDKLRFIVKNHVEKGLFGDVNYADGEYYEINTKAFTEAGAYEYLY